MMDYIKDLELAKLVEISDMLGKLIDKSYEYGNVASAVAEQLGYRLFRYLQDYRDQIGYDFYVAVDWYGAWDVEVIVTLYVPELDNVEDRNEESRIVEEVYNKVADLFDKILFEKWSRFISIDLRDKVWYDSLKIGRTVYEDASKR